ncbi:MAG TPA: hypothetical protein VM261_08620 [Kofleriaceae bacterium]|nr:hypothetical protein [Kofleriaceae bacterium]
MSLVITSRAGDSTLDRAVRLVPIEVISVYTAVVALAGAAILALLIAGALATPLVLALHARARHLRASLAQHLVRVLSFIAWAFAVSNPLEPAPPIDRWIPAISIIVMPVLGTMLFPPSGSP